MDWVVEFINTWGGWVALAFAASQMINIRVVREEVEPDDALAGLVEGDTAIVFLRAELISSVVYCYDLVTDDFVCQGKEPDEILAHFKARHPGHNAIIAKMDNITAEYLKERGVVFRDPGEVT